MAFSGQKVATMLRIKGIKAKEYFAYVYPDRSGNASFSDIRKNNNPKAESLERMADLLQCSIDDLFDRDVSFTTNNVNGDNNNVGNVNINTNPEVLVETNKQLRGIIIRQDQIIEQQNRRIDQLLELASRQP